MTEKQKIIQKLKKDFDLSFPPRTTLPTLQKIYDEEVSKREKVEKLKGKFTNKAIVPGEYQISFTLKVNFKDRGASEEVPVSGTVKIKNIQNLNDVVIKMAEDHIHKEWHNSNVDIIDITSIDSREFNGKALKEIKMKGVRLQYKLLGDDSVINKNEGQCVLDYIMAEMSSKFKMFTRKRLIEELGETMFGYSIDDVHGWVARRKDISMYALSPFNEVIDSHTAEHGRCELTLVFKINNDHCYGVYRPELKNMVAHTKKLDLQKEVFQVSQLASSIVVESIEEYLSGDFSQEIVYVNNTSDLSFLSCSLVNKTGYLLEQGHYRGASLDKMKHPLKDQIIIAADNYHGRKHVADVMYADTNYVKFRWQNQSWMVLSKLIVDTSIGHIPHSVYSPDMNDILKKYPLKPWCVQFDFPHVNLKSFDICKCYTSILLENDTPYNLFNMFDDAIPFENAKLVPGEYCLREEVWMAEILITQWQPLVMIQYLLDQKIIKMTDITHYIPASATLKPDIFVPVVETMMNKFPSSYKHLVNHYIGSLNRRVVKSTNVSVTDSFETAIATKMHDDRVQIVKANNLWLLREEIKEDVSSGHSPIWRHIIAMNLIKLHKLHNQVVGPNTKVISYNTDCITVSDPEARDIKTKAEAKHGDVCEENVKFIKGTRIADLERFEKWVYDPKPWNTISQQELLETGKPALVCGMPGCGKSVILRQMNEDDKKEKKKGAVLGFTNCAISNLKTKCTLKNGEVLAPVDNSYTLDTFFCNKDSRANHESKLGALDVLMMDETGMIPKKFFETIYSAYSKKPFICRFFQDENQCRAIEKDGWQVSLMNSKAVRIMCCQNLCELNYDPNNGRYDTNLKIKLTNLLIEKKLDDNNWKSKSLFDESETDFTITMLTKTRDEINKRWFKIKSQGATIKIINGVKVFEGMPIIIHDTNFKKQNIFNSERYYISKINSDSLELDGVRTLPNFNINPDHIKYGYADTVYRVQGATLRSPYNIVELNLMTLNHIYTAISRATCMEHIGLSYIDKTFSSRIKNVCKEKDIDFPKMTKGYIYKMSDLEGFYIGQTSQDTVEREKQHYEHPTSEKMATWLAKGKKKFEIIDEFNFLDSKEMDSLETAYIAKLNPNMNTYLVVKKAQIAQETKLNEIHYDRFKVVDTPKASYLRIQWKEEGVQKEKKWRYNANNKEEKMKEAKAYSQLLVKQFYL